MLPPVTFLCAKCRYDLVGTRSNICPACGAEFDRNELLRKMGREPISFGQISIILLMGPFLTLAGLIAGANLEDVTDDMRRVAFVVVAVMAVAAPIASSKMIYSEASHRFRHWAHDLTSKLFLSGAIFLVMLVLEAAFFVGAYFLYYVGTMIF